MKMKMKITECKEGDTFTYQASEGNKPIAITLTSEPVPLEPETCGKEKVCAWVTLPQNFLYPDSPCVYGYTNAGIETFDKDLEVNVLHNLYDLGEEKRNEIYLTNDYFLNIAKDFINVFYENEYVKKPNLSRFSDLTNVPLAHTQTEYDKDLRVFANLEDFSLITKVEAVTVDVKKYDSLLSLIENELAHLDFDMLVINGLNYKGIEETFREKTNELFNKVLGNSATDIENVIKDSVSNIFNEFDVSVDIGRVIVTGSRSRGIEDATSDLDVVIEVSSELKEDALFNIIHEEDFIINGIKIDVNPIRKEETGTLETYLPIVEQYLNEKNNKSKETTKEVKNKNEQYER